MGKIKKLHQGALVGDEGSSEEIYPVTAAQAVYHSDGSDLETLIDKKVSIEYEESPDDWVHEWTFYDNENPDGLTICINKDVSGLGNSPKEAISAWWAAQKERQINGLRGFTITISSLGMSPQFLGMFTSIEAGQFIDSITNASQLIFGTEGGGTFTVDASACPYKAPAQLVEVKTASGIANNVSIKVRAIDKTSVKQVTGQSIDDVMSQKAVTDELGQLNDRIVELELHKNPMVVMTENEYDALEIKDPDTYYLIIED